jgi:NitT/TauT family transport system permease protein
MYAGGLSIIVLGICINQIILRIERNSLFWKDSIEFLGQTNRRSVNFTNSLYVPILIGVIVGILFFGGQEVNRVNSQGLYNNDNMSHHNHPIKVE